MQVSVLKQVGERLLMKSQDFDISIQLKKTKLEHDEKAQ